MSSLPDQLPDDVDALKALLAKQAVRNEQLEADKQAVIQNNTQLKAQVLSLTEQLNLALARRYAASSEKISPDQIRMFNEAEVEAELASTDDETDETVIVAEHVGKKTGRKPLPDTLPRVEVIYELDEAQRVCPHDGAVLAEIGDVISEQLDIIPAKIQVIRHIRKQYACRCGRCIKTAALPPQPIPKSLASPGLLAHVVVSKYVMRYRYTAKRISCSASVSTSRGPPWPTGWPRPDS